MRIFETSPDRLILEDRPILLAGFLWLAGGASLWAALVPQGGEGWAERALLLFLGIGVCAVAAVFFPFARIVFDRRAGVMTRRRGHVDRARVLTIALSDVARVRRQSQLGDDGVRMWRLVVETTDGGVIPLETGFSAGDRAEIEAAISEWFKAPPRRGPASA